MADHTLHLRINEERYATLRRVAARARFPTRVQAVAKAMLDAAIDNEAAPLAFATSAGTEEPAGPEALTHPWGDEQARLRAHDGARVLRARKALRLSQAAAGEAAGVSEDVIRRTEKGERDLARYPTLLAWVEDREAAKGGS